MSNLDRKRNKKAITAVIKALEKRYSEPVVMKMSDANINIDTFPSGREDLDIALGGGYAIGKIVEIFAETGFGKTGLALEAVASMQKEGGVVAFIDTEHALNTEYAQEIGVNIDDLWISQPTYGEQAFETIRALISTAEIDLIVIDSVTNMVPKAELEGESGEAKIALQARMMSQGMKLISGPASTVGCSIIFINQMRATIAHYGPSTIPTGGKALKFYATHRLEIRSKGMIKEGEDIIGFKQHIKIVKNKIAPPFKTIDNDIIFGKGVDHLIGFIEAAIEEDIVIRKGGWYSYDGVNIAQGMKKLRIVLNDNPDLMDEIKIKLNNNKK